MYTFVKRNIRKSSVGKQYGELIVEDYAGHVGKEKFMWCKCSCGIHKAIRQRCLDAGQNITCGECPKKHGNQHHAWKGVGDLSKDVWTTYYHGAIARGFEFAITMKYGWSIFERQEGKCALTGRPIVFNKTYLSKTQKTASLDRIDSSKGYIKGNVQWVHRDLNRLKGAMKTKDFINICKEVSAYNSQQ